MVSVLGIHLPDSPDKITHESMTEMCSNIYTFGFSSKLHIKHILRKKS